MTHFRLLRKVSEWSYVIMRKTLWKVGLSTAAVVLLSSSSAYAQATANASLNVNVNVSVARASDAQHRQQSRSRTPIRRTYPTLTAARDHRQRRRAHRDGVDRHADALAAPTSRRAATRSPSATCRGRLRRQDLSAGTAATDGNAGWLVDGPGRSYQCPDLLAREQLGVRAWHVCDDAELHADRSLVVFSRSQATLPERNPMAPFRQWSFRPSW